MKLQYKVLCVFTVILLSVIGCSDNRLLEEKFDEIESVFIHLWKCRDNSLCKKFEERTEKIIVIL